MTRANMGHGQNTDPSCSSGPYNTMALDDSSGHLDWPDPGRSTQLLDTSMATGCSLDPGLCVALVAAWVMDISS